MKWLAYFALNAAALGLAGCGEEQILRLGPQNWNDLQFIVEARPAPIRVGMNEFIVIASRKEVRPGYDLIVSLRVDEKKEWKQAIQDGYTGVYRRAIRINDPFSDVLAVHVRYTKQESHDGENEKILYFPLNQNQ